MCAVRIDFLTFSNVGGSIKRQGLLCSCANLLCLELKIKLRRIYICAERTRHKMDLSGPLPQSATKIRQGLLAINSIMVATGISFFMLYPYFFLE